MKIIGSDKAAFIYKDKEISYSTFIEKIVYLSNNLNLEKGNRTAIFLENRPEWIYSFFASWEKDAINVLIDALASEDEVKNILLNSLPTLIFVSNTTYDVLKKIAKENNLTIQILNVDEMDFDNYNPIETNLLDYSKKSKEDVAVIIYSSGTTGVPKGIGLTYGNLESNIKSISNLHIFNKSDKIISILQFHHSYPLMALILLPLHLNLTNIILERIASDDIFNALQKYQITIMVGVPRLFNLMHKGIISKIQENRITSFIFKMMKFIKSSKIRKLVFKKVHDRFGGHIKTFVSGGAKLDPIIASDLEILGFSVLEGYGLSETAPISAFNTFQNKRIGSVGKPLENVEIKIVDEEIVIKGPNVMKGYYNNLEETSAVLKDSWFYTGDLGYIDTDGYVFITGRKKEMIVLPNGKNISPIEIEEKLMKKSPYIKEIAVIQKDNLLHALILPDFDLLAQNKILNIEETIKWDILDKYNPEAPDYKKIYDFTIIDKELPKTRLGKIKRYNLESLLRKKERNVENVEEPKTIEYSLLKKYLEEVTKKSILPKDHIELDLSLDSIEKVDLQYFLENKFGINIDAEELSKHMIVEELAIFIEKNKQKVETSNNNKQDISEISNINIDKEAKILKMAEKILRPLFNAYFKLEVKGLENIPTTNCIIAPNHQSFLDANLVSSALPYEILKNTYFLATDVYFQSKIMKKIAANANIITVNIDKNLKAVLQKLEYLLSEGKNVLIFPEGAITRDGKVGPFKNAFAILSKQLNVPIVPVTIKGANDAFPWGQKLPKPRKISITFSEAVYPEDLNYDQINQKTREAIISKLEEGQSNEGEL